MTAEPRYPRFDSADPSDDHSAAVKARLDWADESELSALGDAYPLEWDEWWAEIERGDRPWQRKEKA